MRVVAALCARDLLRSRRCLAWQRRVADAAFQAWLQSLWPQAQALGVSRATFDVATRGLEPDLTLPDLVLPGRPEKPPAGQPEFVQTPADYIKEPAIEQLAVQGRKLYDQYRAPLGRHRAAIRRRRRPSCWRSSAAKPITAAPRDKRNAIRVLATQAYLGKRKEKFREEFLLALKILDDGDIKLADMKSSWAGAMGLTQFMPSDYLKYAVDFDGDGRADIWNSVPDALASAAKQLVGKGWQRGLRWAYEVHPPANVDCTIGVPENTLPIGEWLKRGYRAGLWPQAFGRGARRSRLRCCSRPGFTVRRFSPPRIISSSRNTISPISTCCSSAISAIALPIRGRSRRRGARSRNCRPRDLDRMQQILTARGYYHDKIDGKAGMLTRAALGDYQKRNGLEVDCWPTAAVLQQMEAAQGGTEGAGGGSSATQAVEKI